MTRGRGSAAPYCGLPALSHAARSLWLQPVSSSSSSGGVRRGPRGRADPVHGQRGGPARHLQHGGRAQQPLHQSVLAPGGQRQPRRRRPWGGSRRRCWWSGRGAAAGAELWAPGVHSCPPARQHAQGGDRTPVCHISTMETLQLRHEEQLVAQCKIQFEMKSKITLFFFFSFKAPGWGG